MERRSVPSGEIVINIDVRMFRPYNDQMQQKRHPIIGVFFVYDTVDYLLFFIRLAIRGGHSRTTDKACQNNHGGDIGCQSEQVNRDTNLQQR